jgi:hypothetical protein
VSRRINWEVAGEFLLRHILIAGWTAIILAVVGLLAVEWYSPDPNGPAFGPRIAHPVVMKRTRKEVSYTPVRRVVMVAKPTPAQAKKIASKFSLDPLTVPILGTYDVVPLPHGGEAAVTLDSGGSAVLTVVPKAAPFAELGRHRVFGAEALYDVAGDRVFSTYVRQDIARIGRLELKGVARVEYGVGSGTRLLLGGAIEFPQ